MNIAIVGKESPRVHEEEISQSTKSSQTVLKGAGEVVSARYPQEHVGVR